MAAIRASRSDSSEPIAPDERPTAVIDTVIWAIAAFAALALLLLDYDRSR